MTKRRLKAAVAALLLGAQIGSPAAAEPSVEDLLQIAHYIEAGNLEDLVLFLMEHPELMEGDTPLAILLRRFMAEAQDLWAYLAIDPPLRRAVARELLDAGGGSSAPIPPAADPVDNVGGGNPVDGVDPEPEQNPPIY